MNTMKKRILSSVLAIATAASMAVPAFAASETEITATFTETDIAVTVPASVDAVINPYGLGVQVTVGGAKKNLSGQITSAPILITNESTMRLSVGASVTTTVTDPATEGAEKMTLAKSVSSSTKTKTAAVKFQVVGAPATVKGTKDEVKPTSDIVLNAYMADATWEEAQSLQLDTANAVASKTPLATLAPAKMDDAGKFASYEAGSVALARLTGDVVTSPTNAWSDEDAFTATVTYTFTPVTAEE